MKLRYIELPPEQLFNWMSPKNVTAWCNLPESFKERWWDLDIISTRIKFSEVWSEEYDKLTNHFTNLRKSIKKEGIKHPISCVSGPLRDVHLHDIYDPSTDIRIPLEFRNNADTMVYVHPFGGSRVDVAVEQKLNIVPCVVHDFTNQFPDAPEINKSNFNQLFGSNYKYSNAPPHIRCTDMNNKTREAQKEASRRTKEIFNV